MGLFPVPKDSFEIRTGKPMAEVRRILIQNMEPGKWANRIGIEQKPLRGYVSLDTFEHTLARPQSVRAVAKGFLEEREEGTVITIYTEPSPSGLIMLCIWYGVWGLVGLVGFLKWFVKAPLETLIAMIPCVLIILFGWLMIAAPYRKQVKRIMEVLRKSGC